MHSGATVVHLFQQALCSYPSLPEPTYSTTLKPNGSVIQTIDIDLSQLGAGKQSVYAITKAYYNQLENAYVDNIINLFGNIYADNQAFTEDTDRQTKFNFIITRNPNYLVGEAEESSDRESGTFSYVYMKKEKN